MDYKLSENFSLQEFKTSNTHPQLLDFNFSNYETVKLQLLCQMVLQPLRKEMGLPLQVLSGKRSEKLNRAVGGSVTSDHLTCNAADLNNDKFNDFRFLCSCAQYLADECDYRQIIIYPERQFIHVSINIPEKEKKRDTLLWRPGILYQKSAPIYKRVESFLKLNKENLKNGLN
tara:strand:- start:531 stop:1049 length:519 start_codon:yes stop_codon:yes gene_type:complete